MFTKNELRLLRFAVTTAIENELAFVECHRTSWRDGKRTFHKDAMPVVRKTLRTVKQLNRLLVKLGS